MNNSHTLPEPIVIAFSVLMGGTFRQVFEPQDGEENCAIGYMGAAHLFIDALFGGSRFSIQSAPDKLKDTGGKPYASSDVMGVILWVESGTTLEELFPKEWAAHTANERRIVLCTENLLGCDREDPETVHTSLVHAQGFAQALVGGCRTLNVCRDSGGIYVGDGSNPHTLRVVEGATLPELFPDWKGLDDEVKRIEKLIATVGAEETARMLEAAPVSKPVKAKGKSRDADGHRTKTKARGENGRWLKAA